jgi:GntR family transcriptional regulator / MocR family aminotransferase
MALRHGMSSTGSGGDIRVGDAFQVDRRNGRCGATNPDPVTGRRDLNIPGSLRKMFGHKDLGIYLVACTTARLAVGDAVKLPTGGLVRQRWALLTRFRDLPAAWQCPDCETDKTKFGPHLEALAMK